MLNTEQKYKIRKWYKAGVKAKEIAEKLEKEDGKVSLNAINKHISNELKDIKEEHKKNAKEILLNKIGELYKSGQTSIQIGSEVNLSPETINTYISLHLRHVRKEHNENAKADVINKISDSYKKGLTTVEIGQQLGMSASSVKNYTCNLPKDIKNEHEKNYKTRIDIRRENNRLFNQNSNKIMSTKEIVLRNRQSYNTDNNGNLRFDQRRGLLPCDLPELFIVPQF